jgi:hypothetical protein
VYGEDQYIEQVIGAILDGSQLPAATECLRALTVHLIPGVAQKTASAGAAVPGFSSVAGRDTFDLDFGFPSMVQLPSICNPTSFSSSPSLVELGTSPSTRFPRTEHGMVYPGLYTGEHQRYLTGTSVAGRCYQYSYPTQFSYPKFVPTVRAFPSTRVIDYFQLSILTNPAVPKQSSWYFPLFLDLDWLSDSQTDPCLIDPKCSEMVEVRRKLHVRGRTQFDSGRKQFTSLFYPRRAVSGRAQVHNATILNQKILKKWLGQCEPDLWYTRRLGYLRMVNPSKLQRDAVTWLFGVLEFQYIYRWYIYLRCFKFPISVAVHNDTWWNQLRNYYKQRSATVKAIAGKLRARAEQRIGKGLLPELKLI